MGDVALVPERDVFESDDAVRTNDARHTADALRNDRIAFVRHRTRTPLTFGETFLRFAHFRALPVTHVQRKLLERSGNDRERAQVFSVDVALDHLRRNRRGFQTETRTDLLFNGRIQMRKRADRAADLANSDSVFRTQQSDRKSTRLNSSHTDI